MSQVLVGIPSYRRPDQLRACLESIARQSFRDVSVFVADNDPVGQDARAAVAQITYPFPLTCKVVSEPGISAARNAIIEAAVEADFLAMIDDDETASSGWLEGLLKTQRRTKAGIVGGPVRYLLPAETPTSISRSTAFTTEDRRTGITSRLWAANNLLISCRALENAGWPLFDPAFGLSGGEDTEWLGRLPFTFAWCAEATVFETVPPERATKQWVKARAYRIGNSDMRITLKRASRVRVAASAVKSLCGLPVVPLLPDPQWRLWRTVGKLAALFGKTRQEYVRP